MPKISVNVDNRILNFSYLDSGEKPGTSDVYTTVVVFHGLAFNSGIFSKAIALALEKNIRLICINRRDYADTTLFSLEELDTIANGDKEARVTFIQSRALEYATLVTRLIKECSIPAPTPDGKAGGIVLMGWSLGNTVSLGIISAVDTYPLSIKEILRTYVRRLIIHTAPAVALGIPHPHDINPYYPFFDPNIAPENKPEAFMLWASGYFDNGDLSIRDVRQLAYHVFPTHTTYAHMTPEERASIVDDSAVARSETLLSQRFQDEFLEQTRRVLCGQTIRSSLPLLEVGLLYGDSVTWSIIYGAWEIEKMAQEANVRTIKTSVLQGKNTFMFWDHPEESLEALISIC